ncbi:DUF4900 domain-containing protein [Deinococcus knuensis]|uniref:DUF4900 domain-containing protein n=1 Tax=Deinococcus knuensis TaxID=1837380 RepID=A0ABQ2SES6_9DEIO|nr:DUF4900 domain-containing protein [Deinococcus knuensis]GGS17049.1 hypothetical protein GCM10008961_05880 [Deinococcus knuensis]
MRPSDRTQGATLIVSLLFVMLILAVIMSVTAQVTLATRRSSVDQDAIVRAQFAAESGAARVQARLRVMGGLLGSASLPPDGAQVMSDLAALCGLSSLPAAADGATLCTLNPTTGLNSAATGVNARVSLLVNAVNQQAFLEAGIAAATPEVRSRFWSDLFSGTQGVPLNGDQDASTYTVSYGLKPLAVIRDSATQYRVTFEVPDVVVTGRAGAATRTVRVRSNLPTLNLLVSQPSLAPYALLTNHHFNSAASENSSDRITFTSRTLFSGPVHTNQQFMFQGKPWFGGAVTSAGCPAGSLGPQCNAITKAAAQPGAYFAGTYRSAADMTPSASAPTECATGDTACAANPSIAPTFAAGVDWDSPVLPLPINGNNQQAAAQAGGIAIAGNVSSLSLYRDTVGGQDVQRVTFTTDASGAPVTTQLAFGTDRRLRILAPDGSWQDATRNPDGTFAPGTPAAGFNGVIHVSGNVGSLNAGPNAASGAAIAPFAGVTLAADGDIDITSDLRYADPPCSGAHTRNPDGTVTPAPCTNLNAQNILGIYASQGNVNLIRPGNGKATELGNNPTIHAVLMAGQGAVQVDGYNTGGALGSVNLIGGVIENYYGAFGTTSGDVQQTGYSRNFVFDPRTLAGLRPPYFPTAETWTVGLYDGATPVAEPRLRGDTVSTAGNP